MASTPTEIDTLFQLPLGEFTGARNALAARLKKAGERDEAEAVKALSKPSISAWVVNQLYWRQRKAFDRLMASGEQFRQAQASQLAGRSAQIRGPLDARREALSELSRLAASTLTAAAHQPTPDTMRRVTTTLEALSTYGKTPNAPAAGRLTDDVDPPGFETLAALVPSMSGGAPHKGDSRSTVLPFQQKAPTKAATKTGVGGTDPSRLEKARAAQQEAAKAAVHAAERALREAQADAERAQAALKKAADRVKAAEDTRAEAEQRLEKAAEDAAQAKQAARRVAGEAEEAAQSVADAERALEKANRELSGG